MSGHVTSTGEWPVSEEAAPAPAPAVTVRAVATPAAKLALGLAGVCAFLNVYATQPLLPLFERIFHVQKGAAGLTVSAATIAVALASPVAGAVAEHVGRKRMIVGSLFALVLPTLLAATAPTLGALVVWRFAQGLMVPGVYAVAIAYVTEAWEGQGVGAAMAALITGNVIGGFAGRLVSGLVAEWAGWRASFVVLGALTLVGALVTWRRLPAVPRPHPAAGRAPSLRALAPRLAERRLLATYVVGFNVLFTLVATFTYVTFYLAEPPFRLGTAALSSLFVVYLIGAVITPFAGRWIDRVGSRRTLAVALAAAVLGGAFTLVHALWAVVLGLAFVCTSVFVSQSASTSYLRVAAAPEARSTAAGVYVSTYYLGGSVGGILPALAWHLGGWPACVALVAVVQLATIALALHFWSGEVLTRADAGAMAA